MVVAAAVPADLARRKPAPAGFDELMSKTIATALVDRLLQHARIVGRRRRVVPAHPSHHLKGDAPTDLTPRGGIEGLTRAG